MGAEPLGGHMTQACGRLSTPRCSPPDPLHLSLIRRPHRRHGSRVLREPRCHSSRCRRLTRCGPPAARAVNGNERGLGAGGRARLYERARGQLYLRCEGVQARQGARSHFDSCSRRSLRGEHPSPYPEDVRGKLLTTRHRCIPGTCVGNGIGSRVNVSWKSYAT